MKLSRFSILAIMIFISSMAFAQTPITEKIKVWGNCSICKKNIETAAKLPGVTVAEWNKKTKILSITYNPATANSDEIQKKIAAIGYDTEKYKGDNKAYDELDACCQYERKGSTPNK